MAKQWNASLKRKREPCKLPRSAKVRKQSVNLKRKRQVADVGGTPKAQRVSQAPQSNEATPATKRRQKSRLNRGRKTPNDPNGRNTLSNPQYLGPYLVAMSPKKNPEPRSPKIPNDRKGRKASENPQYLGPYLVTSSTKNPEPGSLNIPNNANGPGTSAKPQYLGPYPVTYPKANTKSQSLHIPNYQKGEDAPANPENIGAHPVANILKGKHGKGRPSAKFQYSENYPEANGPKKNHRHRQPKSDKSPKQRASANYQHGGTSQVAQHRKQNRGKRRGRFPNRQKNPEAVGALSDSQDVGTHPVANHPEVAFTEPQLKSPKALDPKGLQASASLQALHPLTTSSISPQLAISLRKQIYQQRPSPARRHSTGALSVRDKLANKFVMGIPKQTFGTGRRRDSTASAAPVMTAEYCGDPFRTAIKERLAAGEPRAPPRSEFAINSRIYHSAGEYAKRISELQKGEEPDLVKQVMSSIAGMAYAVVVKLRIMMRDRWVGYDEFATYHGHCRAIEYNKRTMEGFFREAMPAMLTIGKQLSAPSARPRVNHQKVRDHGRPFDRCLSGRVGKRYRKPKKNRLRANVEELKKGI